jgi:hypothetical protein
MAHDKVYDGVDAFYAMEMWQDPPVYDTIVHSERHERADGTTCDKVMGECQQVLSYPIMESNSDKYL